MASIFVFGSNLAGRHGAGSALEAVRHHGAIYGIGQGFQGRSYAIPTKDWDLRVLPIASIIAHVDIFKQFAYDHPGYIFNVVAIGCGLAGYSPAQIGPMFRGSTCNVRLPPEFQSYA